MKKQFAILDEIWTKKLPTDRIGANFVWPEVLEPSQYFYLNSHAKLIFHQFSCPRMCFFCAIRKHSSLSISWTKFGQKFEIGTKLVILDGRKMTFWTAHLFSAWLSVYNKIMYNT